MNDFYEKYNINFTNQDSWDRKELSDVKNFNKNDYKLTVIAASRFFMYNIEKNENRLSNCINSISIITKEKHHTFLSLAAGVVVQVPSKCIFAAYQRDTYTNNFTTDNIDKITEELAILNHNY